MNKITSFLMSPRVLSFVGHTLAIAGVAGLNDIAANLNVFNLPVVAVTIIGLIIAQIVGALNAYAKGQPAGFHA